tara:strand:- start:48765 stop:49838 length:1074 start_codon:yes stop_codon:yes gene_type:complete
LNGGVETFWIKKFRKVMVTHSRTTISNEDKISVFKCLESGNLTAGELNKSFSVEFAKFIGVRGVRLTVSGTMAFYKILLAYGIKAGDEIAIPDYICNTLLGPIKVLGAIPKIYDNAPFSWNSSIEEILKVVSPRTKVVLVNHTFGFPFEEIECLKKKLGGHIKIVEDSCHRVVPRDFDDNTVCEFSDCAFYSFNSTKYLSTGEGGAIASNDIYFLEQLDQFYLGDQLSDLNCALGLSQLRNVSTFIARRLEIATVYLDNFSNYLPMSYRELCGCYFRFPILVEDDTPFMGNRKVAYRKGVDSLLCQTVEEPYLPNSRKQLMKTISLPIYPSLSDDGLNMVVKETLKILENGNQISHF